MPLDRLTDFVPIWAFFAFATAIALLSIETGQRLGQRRRRVSGHEPEGPVSNGVGAMLGLLGFMLALTLGAASARIDTRKALLIDDVNAIESAYQVASLLPEPQKSRSRELLRGYVELRLNLAGMYTDAQGLRQLDARIRTVQRSLWSQAEALAATDRNSEVYSLFASSLNEILRVHNSRVVLGAQHRIPLLVWAVLFIVTIITLLGFGFHFGLVGRRSVITDVALALTLAMVMTIVFDLDQPGKGLVGVNQQPMYDLSARLRGS